jgi:hypothetical protein
MEILNPMTVTDAMLTSNISITETVWSAGTYTIGTQRYKGTILYEVIVASTSDDPEVGVLADPPTWESLGSINKWKMFNEIVGDQSSRSTPIEVTVVPTSVCNMAALINIQASSVQITVTDDVDGLVYDTTKDTADIGIIDWWEYFFLPYETLTDMIFTDLPSYIGADIKVTITQTGGTALCGELVLGQSRFIGWTQFGTSLGIIDYSKKTTDDLGRFIITPKAFSKRIDFDLDIDTNAVSSVQKYLSDNRTRPLVWVGDPVVPATIVYGFFRNFNIVLSNPASAGCSIQVEGLT